MTQSETTYSRFEAIEAQIAHCYFLFHERFIRNPRFSQFWLEMALQELQHSAMLHFCREHACMAEADINVDASRNVEQLLDVVKGVATDTDVSMDEALYASLQIESSELDEVYEKLTTALKDHNELLYKAMHKDLQAHQDTFAKAAAEFASRPALVRALKLLRSDQR
jgi:urate oxidase